MCYSQKTLWWTMDSSKAHPTGNVSPTTAHWGSSPKLGRRRTFPRSKQSVKTTDQSLNMINYNTSKYNIYRELDRSSAANPRSGSPFGSPRRSGASARFVARPSQGHFRQQHCLEAHSIPICSSPPYPVFHIPLSFSSPVLKININKINNYNICKKKKKGILEKKLKKITKS